MHFVLIQYSEDEHNILQKSLVIFLCRGVQYFEHEEEQNWLKLV